jgi:hypothetical protein
VPKLALLTYFIKQQSDNNNKKLANHERHYLKQLCLPLINTQDLAHMPFLWTARQKAQALMVGRPGKQRPLEMFC